MQTVQTEQTQQTEQVGNHMTTSTSKSKSQAKRANGLNPWFSAFCSSNRPPHRLGTLSELILSSGGFVVVEDLSGGGLADVDKRLPAAMMRFELGMHQVLRWVSGEPEAVCGRVEPTRGSGE